MNVKALTREERLDREKLFQLPDTKLAREAAEVMSTVLPEYLFRHSLRAFLLGRTYGDFHARNYDEESLYLSALFHDAGLTEQYLNRSQAFTVNSCRCMNSFLEEQDFQDKDRKKRMNDAILYHMRFFPAWSKGNEAGLMQIGAWMDAAGRKHKEIAPQVRLIMRKHSRSGMQNFQKTLLGSIGSLKACSGLIFPPKAEV